MDLFEETGLADKVAETLHLDKAEYHQEIRAAAFVLIQLGHPYIWPVDRLHDDLVTAAERLEAMLNHSQWQTEFGGCPELVNAVKAELAVLKSRITETGQFRT